MKDKQYCDRCGTEFFKGLFGYSKNHHKTGAFCSHCIGIVCVDYANKNNLYKKTKANTEVNK